MIGFQRLPWFMKKNDRKQGFTIVRCMPAARGNGIQETPIRQGMVLGVGVGVGWGTTETSYSHLCYGLFPPKKTAPKLLEGKKNKLRFLQFLAQFFSAGTRPQMPFHYSEPG